MNVNGTLYFTVNDAVHGDELWKSNGTDKGTVMVKDIAAGKYPSGGGPRSSNPFDLTAVNGTLFFSADDGVHGRELWKSNGTVAGTVLVKDIAQVRRRILPLQSDERKRRLVFHRQRQHTRHRTVEEQWHGDGNDTGSGHSARLG